MTTDPVITELASLRERMDLIWQQHEREHTQHDSAHGREHAFAQDAIDKAAELAKTNKADSNEWRTAMNDREAKFATKSDVQAILERLDKIERAGLVASERERVEKEESNRRVARSQWTIGLIVGIGAVLINLVIRLWA